MKVDERGKQVEHAQPVAQLLPEQSQSRQVEAVASADSWTTGDEGPIGTVVAKARLVRQGREAVIRELQKAHVFVAAGELAEKRDITLGLEEGDFVEALSGVEAGDRVIVAGQGGLKDGSPVKILGAEEATTG